MTQEDNFTVNVVHTRNGSNGTAKTVERNGGRNTLKEDEGGGFGCSSEGNQSLKRATSTVKVTR